MDARGAADGELDPSFGSGGRIELSRASSAGVEGVSALLPFGDGRFVAVGPGEGKGPWVTQHLADGSLDPGFGTGGGTFFPQSGYSFAAGAVREPSGAIVTAGGEGPPFNTFLARLTPQGFLDPTFGNDPPHPTGDGVVVHDFGEDDLAYGVTLDSSGRIVVVGRVGPGGLPGNHDVLLVRFNADGSVDSSFGGPSGVRTDLGGNDIGAAVAAQGSRIVVMAASGPDVYLLGYRPDGTLDPSFGGGDGIAPTVLTSGNESSALLVQPDGGIVVAGGEGTRVTLERLQADGSPDPSFGSGGVTTFELGPPITQIYLGSASLAQGDDGKTVVAATGDGLEIEGRMLFFRILANGQPDPAWGTGGVLEIEPRPGVSESIGAVTVEPNRRILVGAKRSTAATTTGSCSASSAIRRRPIPRSPRLRRHEPGRRCARRPSRSKRSATSTPGSNANWPDRPRLPGQSRSTSTTTGATTTTIANIGTPTAARAGSPARRRPASLPAALRSPMPI